MRTIASILSIVLFASCTSPEYVPTSVFKLRRIKDGAIWHHTYNTRWEVGDTIEIIDFTDKPQLYTVKSKREL